MSKELRFSSVRQEIPVVLTNENGEDVTFTLREFNDEQRDEYLDFMKQAGITGDISQVQSFSGLQSTMVSKCLYDSDGKLVKQSVIKKDFPASVVTALFMKALEINGLTAEALEEAKNA